MADQPSAPEGSSAPAPKRATTRRRASAGRRATSSGTSGRTTTRRTKAASTKRASTTTRKRATAKTSTARKRTSAAGSTAKRRGRPPGSRNKRATSAATNPADAMSKRISDLISENRTLKARVNELEAGWKKIERALGSEVSKARRTVKRTTRAAARKVEQVVNAVT